MKKCIFVVDDEPDILELISIQLISAGFAVDKFEDGQSFLQELEIRIPELVILDLMLPDTDGFELCKFMRSDDRFSKIPIIMLSAKGEELDKILGLELGADDYVTKPFSVKELVSRVKAVLRRKDSSSTDSPLHVGELLTIDTNKHQVLVKGQKIDLTSTEFKILTLLSSKKGWVFSRDQILNYLWGHDKAVIDRTVDVHIKHLREKLGEAAVYIKNIRGVGYKLEE